VIRRLLLFVLLIAAGSVALFLATSGDGATTTAARQKEPAPQRPNEPPGPSGLMVKSQSGRSEGVPPGVEVRTGGAGKIGSNREVRLPGGKVMLVPEHEITWADATPRTDGSYELSQVVLLLWPNVDEPTENLAPIVRLNAQSMTVVAAQKDGELIIDRTHHMDLRGVVVTGAATAATGGATGGATASARPAAAWRRCSSLPTAAA
jgi:hypothetical protein